MTTPNRTRGQIALESSVQKKGRLIFIRDGTEVACFDEKDEDRATFTYETLQAMFSRIINAEIQRAVGITMTKFLTEKTPVFTPEYFLQFVNTAEEV